MMIARICSAVAVVGSRDRGKVVENRLRRDCPKSMPEPNKRGNKTSPCGVDRRGETMDPKVASRLTHECSTMLYPKGYTTETRTILSVDGISGMTAPWS